MMEDEQVEFIRETSRNTLQLIRKKCKDEETDNRRCIENLQTSHTDVVEIANKLKTKSSISVSELQALKNALYNDSTNIEVVLGVHGALRGLVRELTGVNVNNQCGAAGCLCNLALGDSKACTAITKAASTYLIAALDSLTVDLATTCAWTIGNLSGSNQRVSSVLVSQGAVSKLVDMLPNKGERADAAVYALTRILYSMGDELRTDHIHSITQAISRTPLTSETFQILFYLSCHKDFEYSNEGTNILINKLNMLLNEACISKCTDLDYTIRILANINDERLYSYLLNYFLENNMVDRLKLLLGSDLNDVFLWFLGNMYNLCGDHVFFNMIL